LSVILSHIFEKSEIYPFPVSILESKTKEFLYELLKKRFYVNEKLEITGLRKNRRNEENFKFVVKRAFKTLFRKFKKKMDFFICGQKSQDMFRFYQFYFSNN